MIPDALATVAIRRTMPPLSFDLHVFGLNLSSMPPAERSELAFSQEDIARLLDSLAVRHPSIEAVVVRARNHVEAFVAAPAGGEVIRAWVTQLRHFRPDLLHPRRRALHYHLTGPRAQAHLVSLAAGRYASNESCSSVYAGVKAALGLAARCGTLGETLDGLFVRALEQIHVKQADVCPDPLWTNPSSAEVSRA